jgi:hypothetical protein
VFSYLWSKAATFFLTSFFSFEEKKNKKETGKKTATLGDLSRKLSL